MPAPAHSPRVLLIDEAPEALLVAREALDQSFEIVEARTLAEARRNLRDGGIDLVILDIAMPDGDGIEFCRALTRADGSGNPPPVILLTGRGAIHDKLEGFSAGAEDYIVKPCDPSELQARALLRLRRRGPASPRSGAHAPAPRPPGELHFGDIEFDPKGDGVRIDNSEGRREVPLTHREYRLLLCLARAGGRILSREQIIRSVWDSETRITGRTVDTHICKLRKKISPSRFTIHSVYGAGYRFVEPAEALS